MNRLNKIRMKWRNQRIYTDRKREEEEGKRWRGREADQLRDERNNTKGLE